MTTAFLASLINRDDNGSISHSLGHCALKDLGQDEVLVKVAFSSLNYKDALVYRGHPGIVRHYPHVPGIDAAGTVIRCGSSAVAEGKEVIITGFGLGTAIWGAHAEYVIVPASWVVPLPSPMTLAESMALGTAGITAALCVDALLNHGVKPEQGEILISGASGGVGSVAVALLAKLGFRVAALTRKTELDEYFRQLGAARTLHPSELAAPPERSLHKETWAGAIDTLGGNTLSSILKGVRYGGTVAACGMAENASFSSTVFPFILRGVNLLGIDSVEYPQPKRPAIWRKLANEWHLPQLQTATQVASLADVKVAAEEMLAGKRTGRTVVAIQT